MVTVSRLDYRGTISIKSTRESSPPSGPFGTVRYHTVWLVTGFILTQFRKQQYYFTVGKLQYTVPCYSQHESYFHVQMLSNKPTVQTGFGVFSHDGTPPPPSPEVGGRKRDRRKEEGTHEKTTFFLLLKWNREKEEKPILLNNKHLLLILHLA